MPLYEGENSLVLLIKALRWLSCSPRSPRRKGGGGVMLKYIHTNDILYAGRQL